MEVGAGSILGLAAVTITSLFVVSSIHLHVGFTPQTQQRSASLLQNGVSGRRSLLSTALRSHWVGNVQPRGAGHVLVLGFVSQVVADILLVHSRWNIIRLSLCRILLRD